jgi:predicted transcriptional regulator
MAQFRQFSNRESGTLFPLSGRFRIVQLGKDDALKWTDDLQVLKRLILASQDKYPKIERWLDEKVMPGLRSAERIAWVAYEEDRPIASAVLKLGDRAKFCHLKIDQDFQDMDLGQMFFTQMAMEVRHHAKEIHFTLPESLWCDKAAFFKSFGFERATKALRQYRNSDAELACSAPFATVWSAVLSRLPRLTVKFNIGGYSLNNKILISVKPKYAGRILAGSKLIEVRKKFSNRWVGCRAVLYSSSPQKALVGEATIKSVTPGLPADLWSYFGSGLGCTLDEFEAYVGLASKAYAIELSEIIPYREPISLAQVSHLVREDLTPPQSFCDLRLDEEGSAWSKAVSVASLLHGRFAFVEKAPAAADSVREIPTP